jgi:hypothetical protein
MDLFQLNNKILKGVNLSDETFCVQALEILIKEFENGVDFFKNTLNNSDIDLDFISADLSNITSYISTVSTAKTIAKTVFEMSQSVEDVKMYKEDLNYYKISTKSSTLHTANIKGRPNVSRWSQMYSLLEGLYNDLNRKFDALRSIGSNRRFEIEQGLIEYTIRKEK